MGQIGFIFFAVIGFLVVKEGAEEVSQLTQTVFPLVAEAGKSLIEKQEEQWQTFFVNLLPTVLCP
ncbi:hypothetical protein [Rufibacter tibetensis]|uniref:Uncharacterized protein n=1 Tax=Rufibacter tibetensis TaxID=512763 RepID=A0A0P0CDU0_9BACT|nr:hypothetical protein [Rufibacter tibetensis]ALI99980.1 hypothetical protein DC20_14610 [Rufibacter tibetensis]